jgi:hypothetical protein
MTQLPPPTPGHTMTRPQTAEEEITARWALLERQARELGLLAEEAPDHQEDLDESR